MRDPTDPSPIYPGGFAGIVEEMEARREPLSFAPGESLPPLEVALGPLKTALVDKTVADPDAADGKPSTYKRKRAMLREEFDGEPEICFLHGLLIAALRRRSQPAHTAALFQRLWAEEAPFLLEHLSQRWQVSAITTFGDHGATEIQRRIGHALSVLFGAMKLYESERLYSGHPPDKPFAPDHRLRVGLPMDMEPLSLMRGGLDVNMLGRLWEDAQADPVVAPLAQGLLDQLIRDPGTVFRRLRRMRLRKGEHDAGMTPDAEPAQNIAPVNPARIKTDPRALRWGTVTLTNAPAGQILRFAAHHIDAGAARLHIYLDGPDAEAEAKLRGHPLIDLTVADDAFWTTQKRARMDQHQQRQTYLASQAYGRTDLDWLFHIDVDEFLITERPMTDILAKVSADQAAIHIRSVEQLAEKNSLFKKTPQHAGQSEAVLEDLFPNFGLHLRGGFLSHTQGKMATRTGIARMRPGLHHAQYRGEPVTNRITLDDVTLAHAHAPSWDSFQQHLAFRGKRGSYRPGPSDALGVGGIIDFLQQTGGPEALRDFFVEVNEARPDLVDALEAHGMLFRFDLDLDTKVDRVFGRETAGGAVE